MAALTRERSRRLRLHPRPAQVDVAVAQPDGLVGLRPVVDREGRGLGFVQHLDGAVADLHLARLEPGLTVPSGRCRTVPRTATTHSLRTSTRAVDHALDDAAVVAQVDEGEVLAVLAPAGHPAAQAHARADVCRSSTPHRWVRNAVGWFSWVRMVASVDRGMSVSTRRSADPSARPRRSLPQARSRHRALLSSLRSGRRPTVPASSS